MDGEAGFLVSGWTIIAGPGRRQAYAELLREDRPTRQLMLTLFGTSDLV